MKVAPDNSEGLRPSFGEPCRADEKARSEARREQTNGHHAHRANGAEGEFGQPRPPYGGMSFDDFYAYMPRHKYIYAPTGDLWPAISVNARLPSVSILGPNGGSPSSSPPVLGSTRTGRWNK